MSQSKTKNAAEDLMASLMEELNLSVENSDLDVEHNLHFTKNQELTQQGLVVDEDIPDVDVLNPTLSSSTVEDGEMDMSCILNTSVESKQEEGKNDYQKTSVDYSLGSDDDEYDGDAKSRMTELLNLNPLDNPLKLAPRKNKQDIKVSHKKQVQVSVQPEAVKPVEVMEAPTPSEVAHHVRSDDATVAIAQAENIPVAMTYSNHSVGDKTVAMPGYSQRSDHTQEKNVKIAVGQSRAAFSSGYAAWGNSDSQLAQAENLKIAQEKILEIEKENEKLRSHNEELVAASEIFKERAELLTAQVHEFQTDRDSLEQSFKNEMQLIKNQLHRKDNELQKSQMKVDELDSRLKFDMKKIRIRERELENRLELVRAEKNALVKSKDEQILDLRRKMDQVQSEVESYRQKCVDLNKVLDTNQDSFKRTTRALRLAMANLELQDENKTPLKKAD